MEEKRRSPTPPPCPATVTVRRNPHRKARATPCASVIKPLDLSSASTKRHGVPSFSIDEILSIEIPQSEPKSPVSENLKVFLRIKPLKSGIKASAKSRPKKAWPQNPSKKNSAKENRNQENTRKKSEEACITVNGSCSVTLTPPPALQELKRSKTEVYEGFSYVFPANSSQNEVYEKMVNPLLEDFLRGKSGMLAAMGPSGSGKTHTVFGNPREPGMVPLALRQIFKRRDENSPGSPRSFYLSIFEIYSERGKGERASDLLGDVGLELSVQQSTIKGIQEVLIKYVEEAESLIGQAMLKRATAMTKSNSQSSRSQCIINLRASGIGSAKEIKVQSDDAVLTIVDLAGAEREKRTGNQGARLVESNFINNTSMVFGQCLRSLLEYQKNRKKALQKHFQNSLLTRYLRDYLEGKKRMALILTVKAGEEDYLDTSFLLKQASPYMKIKFDNAEEPCNKRQLQPFPRAEQNKKIKLSALDTSGIEEVVGGRTNQISKEVCLQTKKADRKDKSCPRVEYVDSGKNERDHIIMRNFAKVLWSVLKQYNEKLKLAESEICSLKENLRNEELKSLGLETELISLKSSCLCSKQKLAEESVPEGQAIVQAKGKFEVDTSLVVERLDGNFPCLLETESFANAEGCIESPVPRKDIVPQVKDAALFPRPRSSDNDEEPRAANSDVIVGTATTSFDAEAENFDQQRDHCRDKSAMAGNEDRYPDDSNELGIKNGPPKSDVKGVFRGPVIGANDLLYIGSVVISSRPGDSDGSYSYSSLDLALQPSREDTDQDALIPSPKENEFIQECSDDLSDIQTKSRISHTSPNSEKPKRNRRLLPMSSVSLAEEMNAFNIENQTEKPKALEIFPEKAIHNDRTHQTEDKNNPTLLQKFAKSAQSCNIEVPKSEAKPTTAKKRQNAEKPKRRLLPASSVLLTRDMNMLDIEDEVEKAKGKRGGKKPGTEGQQRTQGSATLLRLLQTNLHL